MPEPWQKGGPSPNPNGRPPGVYAWNREFKGDIKEAARRLRAYMMNRPDVLGYESIPVEHNYRAIIAILDRGLGMPKAGVTVDEDPLSSMTEEEQIEKVCAVLESKGFRVIKGGK